MAIIERGFIALLLALLSYEYSAIIRRDYPRISAVLFAVFMPIIWRRLYGYLPPIIGRLFMY